MTDYLIALNDLEDRTPEYLRGEIFAHGDQTTLRAAEGILRDGLEPTGTTKALIDLMRVAG